ncbi:16S rRNA (cytosine(967)-C(5))-methyltransferase RsmB [soil metagenome]
MSKQSKKNNKAANSTLPPRAEAALLLAQVIAAGKSFAEVFSKQNKLSEKQAFIQELCYGTLRWYFQLEAITQQLLQKPFSKKDADLQALLLIGLYQIIHLRVPDHAAVGETVDAVRSLAKPWSAKVLNAVLRRFLRERDTIMAQIAKSPVAAYAHSQWLLTILQQAWPAHWQTIIETNNSRPPLTLRVNKLKAPQTAALNPRDNYLQLLAAEEISAHATAYTLSGITLEQPCAVTQLPGFELGWFCLQDHGAQLAASLLDLEPGLTVLDACAAPGGKTTHLLELAHDLAEIVAVDIDAGRLERIKENLQRLGLDELNSKKINPTKIKLVVADVCNADANIDIKQSFDRILLDVPCSATGVIRRHPDIKLLRRANDIDQFAEQQQQILKACWPLLKVGGRLLYVTCSILPQENEQQIDHFLSQNTDAKEIPIIAQWGLPCKFGRQILPGMDNMDGFYYACLEKIPAKTLS